MSHSRLYLDYAATTPLDPAVRAAMAPYETQAFGNASSVHQFGFDALAGVDRAKDQVAEFLNCLTSEIIFTSGATEANNLAIQGVVLAAHGGLTPRADQVRRQLITTAIEHPSVLHVYQFLEQQGFEVVYLPVNHEGLVELDALRAALSERTLLVSVMQVNNEIGTIQPITRIGRLVKKVGAVFHVDAVQAAPYLACDVDQLKADLLTLSAHKIRGPKGVGVLYVRKGTAINPLMHGGEQEYGLRPGTYATPAIVGLGEAVALLQARDRAQEASSVAQVRDAGVEKLLAAFPSAYINGSRAAAERTPNNINITFPGVDAENLILQLDQDGIAVSTGSACSAGSLEPSHVLQAIGLSAEDVRSSIRITIGHETTMREMDVLVAAIAKRITQVK